MSADSTSMGDGNYMSGASYATMADSQGDGAVGGVGDPHEELREQDRFLPIANVARIMKKAIPASGKISKEAKECCQECVSEFISFITSEASDRCSQEKRKTINGEDILYAMSTLGFDSYVEPLKLYLQKYRESTKDRAGMPTDDPMFGADGNTIMATLGDNSQGQSVIYSSYTAPYIATPALDTD